MRGGPPTRALLSLGDLTGDRPAVPWICGPPTRRFEAVKTNRANCRAEKASSSALALSKVTGDGFRWVVTILAMELRGGLSPESRKFPLAPK